MHLIFFSRDLGKVEGNGKIKNAKIWRNLFFFQVTEDIYTNHGWKYEKYTLSCIMHFFAWYFSHHCSTHLIGPHCIHCKHKVFIYICFRFVQITQFFFLFLSFITYQTLIFWYIMCTLLKCWTSAFNFFSLLLSPLFSGKLSIELSISNLSLVKLLKKLVYNWEKSLVFQKDFTLLLFVSPMLFVKTKNVKSFSQLVGSHLWKWEQLPRWPFEIISF